MKRSQEIKSFRRPREKHFLMEDGSMIAQLYSEDIHYLKNGVYEEIDQNFIKTSMNEKRGKMLEMEVLGHKLSMDLEKAKPICPKTEGKEVIYEDIIDGVDLKYHVWSQKVKESIILKDKNKIPKQLTFKIETDLELVKNGKAIDIKDQEQTILQIEAPYMIDRKGFENDHLEYELVKKDVYYVTLPLDFKWLKQATFPVIIDPTITNENKKNNVYDTYIYQNDTNVDRNSKDYIRVGVEKINGKTVVNRALLKFELPQIGTGSQIIKADVNLIGYVGEIGAPIQYRSTLFDIHRITKNWDETTANWDMMNNQYDTRIESYTELIESKPTSMTGFDPYVNQFDLTNLVKKWYSGTPNYGIMIKAHKEEYDEQMKAVSCFSKNNTVEGGDPKPILTIQYRNQNGLESYMDYQTHALKDVVTSSNLYNGNLVAQIDLTGTISGKFPVELCMIYNTNDVILNQDYGYGLGYQLNYHQLLEQETIDGKELLKYKDADGTIHYFYRANDIHGLEETSDQKIKRDANTYYDEDGLSLSITKENDNFFMKDSNSNVSLFEKNGSIWYLKEIIDTNNNKIKIEYQDQKITKVIDGNNEEITIIYGTNTIQIKSPNETVILGYQNNQITSIKSNHGITTITYNDKNIIETITDVTKKKIRYDYYQTIPYRLQKMSEYGIENTLGNFLEFVYGFNSTTIQDRKGNYCTYTFNDQGNTTGISTLNQKEEIKHAFGKNFQYGSKNPYTTSFGSMNKRLEETGTIQIVKNYIENSSFEKDALLFIPSEHTIMNFTNQISSTGKRSLEIHNEIENGVISYPISVLNGNNYTVSAYLNSTKPAYLKLSYKKDGEISSQVRIEPLAPFKRYETTLFYPEGATDFTVSFEVESNGFLYIDDVQLEEGEVANLYNLIEDSDFQNGIGDIELTAYDMFGGSDEEIKPEAEVVTLSNGNHALKIHGDPYLGQAIRKNFDISGKAGDTYSIYFWYKNTGIEQTLGPTKRVLIGFRYMEEIQDPTCLIPRGEFSANNTEWQFFEESFQAEYDYDGFYLMIFNDCNVNDLYLTNFALYKPINFNTSYLYDDNGNMTGISDPLSGPKELVYDGNNQLISMMDMKGSNFVYEYDNEIPNRVLKGISGTGISNEIKYDTFGNPIITKITNKNRNAVGKNTYYVRLKGTEKYLDLNHKTGLLDFKENLCSHDKFRFIKENEYYRIELVDLPGYYLYQVNDRVTISKEAYSVFELLKNKNGSYKLKLEKDMIENGNAQEVDPLKRYLTWTNQLVFDVLNNGLQEFYLEETDSKLLIENSATYTEDGKFIKSTKDALGRVTMYDTDPTTGLTKSITEANGIKTSYTYNDKKQLIKVEKEDKSVEYTYNESDLLEKIKHGKKEYQFFYDEFLNTSQIKIGNQTLITSHYEANNGPLNLCTYGNGGTVHYVYDDFDRIKKVEKENDQYTYVYDNLGNIAKVKSNQDDYRYYYDTSNRMTEYDKNQFQIKYAYDNMSNISDKYFGHPVQNQHLHYEYDLDNSITKLSFDHGDLENEFSNDEGSMTYQYDELGRLKEKVLNDIYKVKYHYVTKGYKTSFLIDQFIVGEDTFDYKYDSLDHITDIYCNRELQNHYEYDNHNELIKDDDYNRLITTLYTYDNVGNIISKKEYELGTEILQKEYQYEYSNSNWEDQLTRFNGEEITYDEIGNPITIGNKCLSWINGRQLKSVDNISYEYDKDSIRTKKRIGEKETIYYVEDNNIIFEETEGNVLYYIRDESNHLIGFQYKDQIYYYKKNLQEDIIGILDSNCNEIAQYQYDAYGKIISIKDSEGIDITDPTHIAHINPFRYRSYYYDKETDLYYLNSRYYNPNWGRFLNADAFLGNPGEINYNLYCYCINSFVNMYDEDGEIGIFVGCIIIGAVAGGFAGGLIGAAKSKAETGKVEPFTVIKYSAIGAIGGATIGSLIGKGGESFIQYATTGTPDHVGKMGERFSGITSNKEKQSIMIHDRKRIPDKITRKYIEEVKNTRRLSLTQQINDYMEIAKKRKVPLRIRVRHDTIISGPLLQVIRDGKIIIKRLPW